MILRYNELKKENADLYALMGEQEERMKKLEEQLAQMQKDYDTLKMARMMTIVDKDLDSAKERVARMIRDVNKCIAVLSDEQ